MKELEEKYCPKCNKTLPVSDFRKSKKYRSGYRSWCNGCESKCAVNHYKRNRKNNIEYRRKHVIQSSCNGKRIWIPGLEKRDMPENMVCEVCHNTTKKLSYHHWSNDNPSNGIWVCHSCHSGCNFVEKQNLINRYLSLKLFVEKNHSPDTTNVPMGVAEFIQSKDTPKKERGKK